MDYYVYLRREMNMSNIIASEMTRKRRAAWTAVGSTREVGAQVNNHDLTASIFNTSLLATMCCAIES